MISSIYLERNTFTLLTILNSIEQVFRQRFSLGNLMLIYYFVGANFEFFFKLANLNNPKFLSLSIISYIFVNPPQAAIGVASKKVKRLILQNASTYAIFTFVRDLLLFVIISTLTVEVIFCAINYLFYGIPLGSVDHLVTGKVVTFSEFFFACMKQNLKAVYQPLVGVCSSLGRSIYVGIEKIGSAFFRVVLKRYTSIPPMQCEILSYVFNISILLLGCSDVLLSGWDEEKDEVESGNNFSKEYFRENTPAKESGETFFSDLTDGMVSKLQLTLFYSFEIVFINIWFPADQMARNHLAFSVACHYLTDIFVGVSYALTPYLMEVKNQRGDLFYAMFAFLSAPLLLTVINPCIELISLISTGQSYFSYIELPISTLFIFLFSWFRGLISLFNSISIVLEGRRVLSEIQSYCTLIYTILANLLITNVYTLFYSLLGLQLTILFLGISYFYYASRPANLYPSE